MHESDELNETSEQRIPLDSINPRWELLVALCCSPLFILFAHFDDPGRGMAAMIGATIIVTAVRYFWDLRNHHWFWMTATFIVSFHAALVLLIPWPDVDYRGVQLLPFALLDWWIVYGTIRLVEITAGWVGKAGRTPPVAS